MPGEFICDFAYEFTDKYSEVEEDLHNIFNQLRVNGEWFNINSDALKGIRSICEKAGGKLITEEVEDEIIEATSDGESDFDDLEKSVSKRYSEKALAICNIMNEIESGFELKYNKRSVWLVKNGVVHRFLGMFPKKGFLKFRLFLKKTEEVDSIINECKFKEVEYEDGVFLFRIEEENISNSKQALKVLLEKAYNDKKGP